RWADLLVVDLDHPSLAGAADDTLLDAFLFGAADGAVAASAVAGRWSPSPGAAALAPARPLA
ncbi:MAG TPA: formimidoylglutamate deiminase, partial [Thermoanaerobaculia bacterium]